MKKNVIHTLVLAFASWALPISGYPNPVGLQFETVNYAG